MNTLNQEMKDFEENILNVGDVVLFPGGRELMKGTIKEIKANRFNIFQAYVENEAGYKKWKISSALIKVNK